jgi:DNA mismatch repair ATPase MutL
MRKIVIFTIIVTIIFAMIGCTAHSEPDKKAAESLSSNVVIDTMQSEKLSEKTENETVEKSTFAQQTTQPTIAETDTEKVSKEPIISQITTANTEPKQDTQRQKETPESEIYESEITTNTASEITTAVEQIEGFDISYWISYAQNYAQSIGLTLEETAIECWDNPISANASSKNIGADIESRMNRYKNTEKFSSVWIWAEKLSDTQYELYIGYA